AFVAVDRSEVVNEGGRLQEITQAVETPAGWQANGLQARQLLASSVPAPCAAPPARAPMPTPTFARGGKADQVPQVGALRKRSAAHLPPLDENLSEQQARSPGKP